MAGLTCQSKTNGRPSFVRPAGYHTERHSVALPEFDNALDTPVRLEDVLDDLGFSGLWRSCSMDSAHEQDRKYFTLTERLIELIII
ncbi:hypothetical protein HYQ46_012297 [Verticillium longisporum]|nr:hypothetical protein HYQ46_012297 [Verticillium longisporum]